MSTLFHRNVERSRKRPARLSAEAEAMAALKARLPTGAVALAVADWPGILICHQGKVFGLSMKLPGIPLTLAQTNAVTALRASGLRVEVAQGPEQVIARAHEMGVALKDDQRHLFRDHFRGETRRRS